MSDNAPEQLGEALGGGLLDEAVIEPIDPDEPVAEAAKLLGELVVADPERDKITSGVVGEVFAAIRTLDRPGATSDALNNVGCAWALLAYNEGRLEYWPRARQGLKASHDHKDATEGQRARATENLERVKAARTAMESLS